MIYTLHYSYIYCKYIYELQSWMVLWESELDGMFFYWCYVFIYGGNVLFIKQRNPIGWYHIMWPKVVVYEGFPYALSLVWQFLSPTLQKHRCNQRRIRRAAAHHVSVSNLSKQKKQNSILARHTNNWHCLWSWMWWLEWSVSTVFLLSIYGPPCESSEWLTGRKHLWLAKQRTFFFLQFTEPRAVTETDVIFWDN